MASDDQRRAPEGINRPDKGADIARTRWPVENGYQQHRRERDPGEIVRPHLHYREQLRGTF